jgi:tetratricopeptide (TPR) repeat protein
LAIGDITPLLEGAAQLTRHGIRIEKKKNRELRVIVQSYLQLLSKVQFEVNSRRGDLVHENDVAPTLFVTKSLYESFTGALAIDDPTARVSALQTVCAQCPAFREAKYYLADALYRTGDIQGAVTICASLAEEPNPILQRDGFLGEVKADLGFYLLQQGKPKESLEWSKASLTDKPANPVAYNNIAVALMNLKQYEEAGENWAKCIELQPDHAWFWWTGARLAAASEETVNTQLVLLRAALTRGFDDFEAIRSFRPLSSALKSPFGTHLLRPQLGMKIDFDLLYDDLYLTNASHFPLSDVRGKAKFTFSRSDDQKEETVEASFTIPSLANGEEVCVADVASMPKGRSIAVELSYTCDQGVEARHQVFFYNWLGSKKCMEKDFLLNSCAWQVYEKKDSDSYRDAQKWAREAVDYSLRQDPNILDTLAWLSYELGEKALAKQLMDEAIELLDRDNEEEKAKQYRARRENMK